MNAEEEHRGIPFGATSQSELEVSLEEATSVASFESSSRDQFQRRVTQAFRRVLRACARETPHSIISYDTTALRRRVGQDIDWRTLFSQHDDRAVARRLGGKDGQGALPKPTTALMFLVRTVLEDPCLWPVACHGVAIHVCWAQILAYNSKQHRRAAACRNKTDHLTPAQRLVWESVLRLWKRSRALHTTALDQLVPRLDDQDITWRACRLQFTLLEELRAQPWVRPGALLSSACRLLRATTQQGLEGATSLTRPVEPTVLVSNNKASTWTTVEEAHGWSSDEGGSAVRAPRLPKVSTGPGVSLSRILQQRSDTSSRSNDRVEADRWKDLRGSILSFAIDCAKFPRGLPQRHLHELWVLVLEQPLKSAVLRLLIVRALASQQAGAESIDEWLLSLFTKVADQDHAEFALRYYTELIVELSAFDDARRLYRVTVPLIKCILDECDRRRVPSETCQEITTPRNLSLQRALAYLLSRRGKALNGISHFASVKAEISLAWPSAKDWIDHTMSPKEKSRVLLGLQQGGILGVCDTIDDIRSSTPKADFTEEWPFSEQNSIRSVSRLFRRRDLLPLALSPFHENDRCEGCNYGTADTSASNFLHDDVLHRTFAYLGFKRLNQVRLVCQEWKGVADNANLWQSFYEKRYGTMKDDPLLQTPLQAWKTHFHHRFLVEREVRSRSSRGSKKFRICKYVGCHHIMTTPLQLKKHNAAHQKPKRCRSCTSAKPAARKRKRDKASNGHRKKVARKSSGTQEQSTSS
jgi:hypothetical protein